MPLIDAVGTLENRPSLVARLAVVGWLMVSCLAPAAARGEDSFSFGVVPQFEARHLAAIWQPILEELGARTGYRFDLVGSPRIPAFEASFLAGEFDFAYMNPYHAMLAAEGQGYVPLVRDGAGRLRGILVVRDDSPYRDVADLEGRRIAFPSPNALGASLLMRADLARPVRPRFRARFRADSFFRLSQCRSRPDGGGRWHLEDARSAAAGGS